MRYMLNISDEEKQALLNQHSKPYDGYQTLRFPEPDNRIHTYDPAGDKGGITVNNRGEVGEYRNMNINEMKYDGKDTGLFSDEATEDVYSGSHGFEPEETFEELDEMQLDTIGDGPMDLEHGTVDFNEEVCSICGMIDCECDHHDDSIFDELDDDMVEPLQEQLNRTIDMFNRFKKY